MKRTVLFAGLLGVTLTGITAPAGNAMSVPATGDLRTAGECVRTDSPGIVTCVATSEKSTQIGPFTGSWLWVAHNVSQEVVPGLPVIDLGVCPGYGGAYPYQETTLVEAVFSVTWTETSTTVRQGLAGKVLSTDTQTSSPTYTMISGRGSCYETTV